MIIVQQLHDLFRLSTFGEGREAAQIAEEDGDVAAVAFQDALISGRDDQFGERWREKPLEPGHPLNFRQLRRDPLFEGLVPSSKLGCLCL